MLNITLALIVDTYMLLLLTIIATCALLACMKYLQLRDPV